MGTHMKTTIDIADSLLLQAKGIAKSEGITLRELVETGLRATLHQRGAKTKPFVLRDASFKGEGLQPGIREGDWKQIREMAYEGRGGFPELLEPESK